MKQVSGKEFCKIIEQNGWLLKRVNGSHFIYMKDGKDERLTIPMHKNMPLKLGLLKALMKIADLNEVDL
jgi:predicted RNA binding protein YcfA (HicA-like mRNA interferase family)